jgi:hypothetical protein
MKLTPKIQRFIDEYLVDFNGARAAKAAGYSKRRAKQAASELVTNRDVREIIEKRKKELADACGIAREDIVRGTVELIQRCNKTGAKYRPQMVLRAYEFLARLNGLIIVKTAVVDPEPTRELDFGDLPIPPQPGKASKPN